MTVANRPRNASSASFHLRALTAIALTGAVLFSAGIVSSEFLPGHVWLAGLRWAGLICLAVGGVGRQSLTYWILFAMLLGGEIGLDRPGIAEHLRFLSDIFLRLIKVIVAPLILGSLISGIAGHGDLRGLGRVSVKTFVYFELVTTLGLFIGVAAIDISRAGEGLALPQTAASPAPPVAAPISWDEFLVRIFPENLAKSVAEGQILQVAVFAVGAISWCGSLSHNGYDNNVSRITANVLRKFMS